jgi:hypothetical protein
MASSNSVTLFSSVILGIVVYGERLATSGAGHVSSAGVGLLIAIGGIALLAGSAAPQSSEPSGQVELDPSTT